MRKVKEVLRLRYELGMSYSQIRQSCGVSLGTVNNLLTRAEQAGLTTWDQVRDLDEGALEKRLYQRADDGHWLEARPLPDWAEVDRDLASIPAPAGSRNRFMATRRNNRL